MSDKDAVFDQLAKLYADPAPPTLRDAAKLETIDGLRQMLDITKRMDRVDLTASMSFLRDYWGLS